VKFVTLVEKQKETISGESSDRSQKKKLGKESRVIHLMYSCLVLLLPMCFCRAMLCMRGLCCHTVCACLCVCHVRTFCQNE